MFAGCSCSTAQAHYGQMSWLPEMDALARALSGFGSFQVEARALHAHHPLCLMAQIIVQPWQEAFPAGAAGRVPWQLHESVQDSAGPASQHALGPGSWEQSCSPQASAFLSMSSRGLMRQVRGAACRKPDAPQVLCIQSTVQATTIARA